MENADFVRKLLTKFAKEHFVVHEDWVKKFLEVGQGYELVQGLNVCVVQKLKELLLHFFHPSDGVLHLKLFMLALLVSVFYNLSHQILQDVAVFLSEYGERLERFQDAFHLLEATLVRATLLQDLVQNRGGLSLNASLSLSQNLDHHE